jgi:glutaredoxin
MSKPIKMFGTSSCPHCVAAKKAIEDEKMGNMIQIIMLDDPKNTEQPPKSAGNGVPLFILLRTLQR